MSAPASVTSMWINTAGFAIALLTFLVLRQSGIGPLWTSMLCMAALGVSIASMEMLLLRTHRRASAGLRFEQLPPTNTRRVLIKLLGFYATVGLIGLIYLAGSPFAYGFYNAFWQALRIIWPWAVMLQVVYFFWVDRRMLEPEDAYWQVGSLLLGRTSACERETLKQHALGWAVKGFFLPLMFSYLVTQLGLLKSPADGFLAFYDFMFIAVFAVDLLLTCVGYVLTLRLFDAHIRSTEPTVLGWFVTIICYYPVWGYLYNNFLHYQDGDAWGTWLSGSLAAQVVWGSAIIALNIIYVWATLAFGIRFSNLTHRGVLTNGPYAYTKHPAYVAKNLTWWLIAVPFLPANGWLEAAQQSLMLFTVNVIYYLRAVTEERHLSRDPDYVRYALWMNEHSLFSFFGRRLRFLRYRAPATVTDAATDAT